MGIDPNMRASHDSDFGQNKNKTVRVLDSSLSISNKPTHRNLLREIDSITEQQAATLQRDGMAINDITFIDRDVAKET